MYNLCWAVPLGGFEIIESPREGEERRSGYGSLLAIRRGRGGQRWLQRCEAPECPEQARICVPMANPALFREFAALSDGVPDRVQLEKRLVGFANEYGMLLVGKARRKLEGLEAAEEPILSSRAGTVMRTEDWVGAGLLKLVRQGRKSREDRSLRLPDWGESVRFWERQICEMATVVSIWEAVQVGDQERLAHFVSWERRGKAKVPDLRFHYQGPGLGPGWFMGGTSYEQFTPEVQEAFSSGDLTGPGRYAISQIINEQLQCHTLTQQLSVPDVQQDPKFTYGALTLIGCLWLQLAGAVDKGKEQSQCAACSKWFALTGRDGKRKGAKYCSDACKQQEYRSRQRQGRPAMAPSQVGKTAADARWEREREQKNVDV